MRTLAILACLVALGTVSACETQERDGVVYTNDSGERVFVDRQAK